MVTAEITAKIVAAHSGFCDCPLHTLIPMRIAEIVEPTFRDRQAACDLIGKDTYGRPHWTPETIDRCNPVVQAFARHALAALPCCKQPEKGGA